MQTPREICMKLLVNTEKNASYSNIALDKTLTKYPMLRDVDKRFISALYYGVIERKITLDEIIKKYGEPTINLTVAKIGVASWIEGVTEEEYNEKGAEAFEGSKVLVVTFNLQGKASTAVFKEFTKEDAK